MPESDVTVSAVFKKTAAEERENLALGAKVMGYNKFYRDVGKTGPGRLFDGDRNAKWTVSGVNGWVAFDIGESADIDTMKIWHAGTVEDDTRLNTASYDLYVLNESLMTEERFGQLSPAEKSHICEIPRYWKKIYTRSGNTDNITEDKIELDSPRRYFKFNARKTNSIGKSYSVNIYELEMYAKEN